LGSIKQQCGYLRSIKKETGYKIVYSKLIFNKSI
jgi:hypothetical protein